jgi:hypothetical protein
MTPMTPIFYCHLDGRNNMIISEEKPDNFETLKMHKLYRVPNESVADRLYIAWIKLEAQRKL